MHINIRQILAVALVIAATALVANAQEPVEKKGGHFANLFTFEFKPGKTDEALGILRSTLIPAYEATGIHPTVIEDLLGTKDVILIVPLKNGPEYYKYEVPPQDAAAFKALIKNAGSPDKAEEQLDKFIGYVVRQSQKLVFVNDRE
jgi:hypothetical protein